MTREVMARMTRSRQAGIMTSLGATVRVVRFEPVERAEEPAPTESVVPVEQAEPVEPVERAAPVVV